MADYTFIEMKEWFYNNAPKIINEKYFLYVMGSIFLLGIFTKWLAAFGYGRMIRKAEHMSNPKNATLRQIKMKYDSIKEINGHVANPMIFAARSLNKCKLIAGMEGALASVIGGMADCPVIAVPTSVGYGANFGGLSALLSMLNSCASGVSVVNIDNGFGAAYQASMINHMRAK